MSLESKVGVATTWSAGLALTVALVVATVFRALVPEASSLVFLGGLAAVGAVCLILVNLGMRLALRRSLWHFSHLATNVRELTGVPGPRGRLSEVGDEEGVRVAGAINALLDRVDLDRQAVHKDLQLLHSLMERSPNGLLVCQSDGLIRFANPAFRQMFEMRAEPEGARPVEVLAVPEIVDLVNRALSGEEEGELRTYSGRKHLHLRAIVIAGGDITILAQDLTRFRLAERARTDFVANVSHELRTPMAAILGYAETLAMTEGLNAQTRRLLDALTRNSRRLRDTFEGLLRLARVESRLAEALVERLRLEPLVLQAIIGAVDAAGRKSQDFEFDCPDDIEAWTNAEALDAIVSNLASNAVKYTPEGGSVLVRVYRDEDEVIIAVRDTGIGIEAADHDRIFERFFRVDEGRAPDVGGTGLGLAMVRHLALATGVRISVDSELGNGATFSVHLRGGQ
ncbi:MAG: two-component system phosphate regulon sensor histidine kinase PhoR [Kiritimatiellia bacterium]|jgi:two-component system phosphate regulon sensor histidine kinase PhoR